MKKKREILKDYTNKLKQFKKYNKAYFEDDDPIISDAKYGRFLRCKFKGVR